MSPISGSTKHDFARVKNEVTESLDDEAKLLWCSILKWLEDSGEESVRKQLEALTENLRNEGLSRITDLKTKLPVEE